MDFYSYLDRNAPVCNNILELAGNPFTAANGSGLSPDPTYENQQNLPLWARISIGVGAIILGALITCITGGLGALPAYGMVVGVGASMGVAFEVGRQVIAKNGFSAEKILMAGLGGASAAGLAFAAPASMGYVGSFIFGGIGSVVGGTVSGSVNSWKMAGAYFVIGGILSVCGRYIGTRIANLVNSIIAKNAQQVLENNPLVAMMGDTLEDLIGTAYMNPIMQSSTSWLQSVIVNSVGGFSNSLIYILLREVAGILVTSWM